MVKVIEGSYWAKEIIWNPGILPAGWDINTLLGKHSSQPYNPDIVNAFFRAEMIENWGRGIEMIIKNCKEYNSTKPIVESEGSGFWLEFPFNYNLKTAQETTQETTQEKILKIIIKNPFITQKQIAEMVQLSPDGVKYHLTKLRKKGIIKHVGPTKTGYRKILKDD